MVTIQILTSLLTAFSVAPIVFGAHLPHNPNKEFNFGEIFDPANFNETSSGSDILDTLFNDPEIPFTEMPDNTTVLPDVIEHGTLQKRALKRYNYLKWKVTLKGYVNHVQYRGQTGRPVGFTCTSADVYVFDKFRRNARDVLIKWRNPDGGDAVPGSIFWMTNKRLYKFVLPGDSTEPTWYDDTVPVIWEKQNQLYAWETYRSGQIYNRRNRFTIRYTWFAAWALAEGVRSGGMRINWAASGVQKMVGELYVQSLGYPYQHNFYYATINGQFQLKGYANL